MSDTAFKAAVFRSAGVTEEAVTAEEMTQVADMLRRTYGTPDPGNFPDPLDELIVILISTRTTHVLCKQVFGAVKRRFPTWQAVLDEPVETLAEVLKPAGLSRQKAGRIHAILERLKAERGHVDLNHLLDLEPQAAERYLLSLPGVGKKIARCLLIYSLAADAFPVDTHVLRVCKRLGWIPAEMSWAEAHDVLQAMLPPGLGHDLHVNMIVHGRERCHAVAAPACEGCPISDYCRFRAARETPRDD